MKMQADRFLDITHLVCPVTYVKVSIVLDELEEGQILEIRMNAGEPIQNVPRSLKEDGHKIRQVIENADGTFTVFAEKGDL